LNGIARIATGDGDDTVIGSAGNDIFTGGAGTDRLSGRAGNDQFQILAGAGKDVIDGGEGWDTIIAAEKNVTIFWNTFTSIEEISGGGFADVDIAGSDQHDIIDLSGYVLTGIRRISGGAGIDRITGSAGDDTIVGGTNNDILAGGDGNDVFIVASGDGADTFDGGAGSDSLRIAAVNYALRWASVTSVETIDASAVTGATIVGGSGDEAIDLSGTVLKGVSGILAGTGADIVVGSAGADRILGGSGADDLTGGGGADIFAYTNVTDSRTAGGVDRILDFQTGVDLVDLSAIDASAKASGNQAFVWIGNAAFSGVAGQLRAYEENGSIFASGDINGDKLSDFMIEFVAYSGLNASDFVL